ncbi:hypothetical protein O3P69_018556 [Scylla paramamosain]|uniref:Uncharacterized protein n=1 Tax=Scylla paramamosain TaxID=85552 RepID=A0AAW0T2S3_SCYPA
MGGGAGRAGRHRGGRWVGGGLSGRGLGWADMGMIKMQLSLPVSCLVLYSEARAPCVCPEARSGTSLRAEIRSKTG